MERRKVRRGERSLIEITAIEITRANPIAVEPRSGATSTRKRNHNGGKEEEDGKEGGEQRSRDERRRRSTKKGCFRGHLRVSLI